MGTDIAGDHIAHMPVGFDLFVTETGIGDGCIVLLHTEEILPHIVSPEDIGFIQHLLWEGTLL